MPKISVIIPVYNSEKYLSKCLDSIVNQTLEDIGIICINDCSTDGSFVILQEYASKDERIKLLDLPRNEGAGNARNKGLELADGEYIGFIDSDDFADLNFYECLYNAAKKSCSDIAKGSYKYIYETTADFDINKKIKEDKNNFSFGFCSAIFKNSLIKDNSIKFPNLTDMEDPIFAYSLALKANRIEILPECYINICTHKDSKTAGIPDFSRIKDKFAGLEQITDLANNSEISENSYAYTLSFWIKMVAENSLLNKELECRQFVADKIMELCDKIKYKDSVLRYLAEINVFLAEILQAHNTGKILHYEQAQKIYYIREKMRNG